MQLMQDTVRAQILSINEQLKWKPVATRKIRPAKAYVLCGMGGSHLAADLLKAVDPTLPLIVHKSYGLPHMIPTGAAVIVSSYSGNTAETLSAYEEAKKKKLPIIAISSGGKLQSMSIRDKYPHIAVPVGFQPRMATGIMMLATLFAMNKRGHMKKLYDAGKKLRADDIEDEGMKLAAWYKGGIPIIYSSARYFGSAYCMKIALNETGKSSAFCNEFPELNHNEMNGFGAPESRENASYRVLVLKFAADDKRIIRRIDATVNLLSEQKVEVTIRPFAKNSNPFVPTLQALLLGEWAAVHLAAARGADPEGVPMVEGLKKIMKGK